MAQFQRRKADRPAEITEAALAAFAENGYAATRVDDVAKRAGVSKGLLYLYFKTKEDLFKAVIRSFIVPRLDDLMKSIEESNLSTEAFLRGPFLDFAKKLPHSRARILIRLIVAEGPKHPDLIAFYWDNVVSRGLDGLRGLVAKGVARGEIQKSALDEFPHLLLAPVMFSVLFTSIFDEQLDTDGLLEGHIEMMLRALLPAGTGESL